MITATVLQKSIARADAVWANNQSVNNYAPEVGVLTAIRSEQTARLAPLQDKDKDRVMRIIWVEQCGLEVTPCSGDDCSFTGEEADTKAQDLVLDLCGEVPFTINDDDMRSNEFSKEDMLAKQYLAAFKALDEDLAQKTVVKLNTFLGVNQYTGGIGTPIGVVTYIPAPYWTPDMYSYFNMVSKMNKLNDPFMIHGSNLSQQEWMTNMNQSNPTGAAERRKLLSIRSYWDLFNIDLINDPNKRSYMIAKGAVAFVNKAKYPLNAPVSYKFGDRWSVESKALPGVYYDLIYKERCVGENVYYDFKMKYKAGVFLNPLGCNANVTGVLAFDCGTGPAES